MDEYSFQLTDLVSEETQVNIGELLGADTIITGYITSLPDRDNINIQIIDVHTGAVVGGFSLDYQLDGEFGRDYSSETIVVERKYEETSGIATKTIIFENFNNLISDINPSHFEEYWGEQILSASAETGTDPEGFAYMDFLGEFHSVNYLEDWNDSDITYYMDLPLKEELGDSDGIYVRIKPEDFSRIYLFVKQENNGEVTVFGSNIDLIMGEWNNLNIPFSNLAYIDGEKKLNRQKKITFSIGIPFIENIHQFYFTEKQQLKSRLSIDEIGFYTLKNKEEGNVISNFEDEINRALIPII